MTKLKLQKKKNFWIFFYVHIYIDWYLAKNFYGKEINLSFFILSSILFAITFLKPNFYTIPNILWIKFGFFLGSFIAPIVMLCIYFFLVFPINLILK